MLDWVFNVAYWNYTLIKVELNSSNVFKQRLVSKLNKGYWDETLSRVERLVTERPSMVLTVLVFIPS